MVYILLADGFEETEAIAPYDILKRAGVPVRLVSVISRLCVKGAHGLNVLADINISEMRASDIDMLVIPGGMPGTTNIDALPQIDVLLDYCDKKDRYVAAICAGPSVVGKRGYLNGKKAICYPGFEKYLEGAEICDGERVVADGKYITAIGAGAAVEFGLKLAEIMTDAQTSEKIRESIH